MDTAWLCEQEARWPLPPAADVATNRGAATDADWPRQHEQGRLALAFDSQGVMSVRAAADGEAPAGIVPVPTPTPSLDLFGMGKAQAQAQAAASSKKEPVSVDAIPF